VTGCLSISEPGTYLLQDHVILHSEKPCFEILADNVMFDCRGLSINYSRINSLLTNNYSAVLVAGVSNATVRNCVSQNFKYGILLWNSRNSRVSGNGVFSDLRGTFGVFLNGSEGNEVSNNILSRMPFGTGVGLENSSSNTISFNRMDFDLVGIYVRNSWNNDFLFNNFSKAYLASVQLFSNSDSNRFVGNRVVSSFSKGAGNSGIYVQDSKGTALFNNTICANYPLDVKCVGSSIQSFNGNFCNETSPGCALSCSPCLEERYS